MRDQNLMTGVVSAVVAAVCAAGLTAWLSKIGNVLLPALILCAVIAEFGLYRKHCRER